MILNSKFPTYMAWGSDLISFYNDAYRPILGTKREALGRPFREVWSEIWDDVGPIAERALAGEASYFEDMLLVMERHGYPEETWWTFSYSPIRDETEGVAGVLCIVHETTAGVKARAALRQEKERLHELFRQAPGFMAVLRQPNHVFEITNAAYLQLVGHGDLIGKPVREALPELEGQGFYELLDRVYAGGEPFIGRSMPVRLQRQPGASLEERFVDFIFQPIRDANGQVTGIFCEGSDVTERKRAEEANAHLAAIVASSQDAIISFAPDGTILTWNPGAEVMFGYTAEEAVGQSVNIIVPDDLRPERLRYIGRVLAGEVIGFETVRRRKNGTTLFTEITLAPMRDAEGQALGFSAIARDVSERRSAEQALRESEGRFRHMADSAPALIWMTDENGRHIFANMHYDHLFGRPASEMLGDGWKRVLHPDDVESYEAAFLAAFQAREPFRREVRVIDKEGGVRWMRCEAVRRLNDAGTFLGYTGLKLEITDVKMAEERRDLLINELNHRVKNTLATVQSIATQTLRNASTTSQAREDLDVRLLALSRTHDVLTRESWEGAGLHEIILDALNPYRGRGEKRFRIGGPELRLTPRMALALALALHELATNAVKYGALSNETGEISIAWTLDSEGSSPQFHLRWEERGGPPVEPPKRRGFGTRLIERSLAQDLGGDVRIEFAPTGLVCSIDVLLASNTDL
jgi:PAS domain S-box-containing protein